MLPFFSCLRQKKRLGRYFPSHMDEDRFESSWMPTTVFPGANFALPTYSTRPSRSELVIFTYDGKFDTPALLPSGRVDQCWWRAPRNRRKYESTPANLALREISNNSMTIRMAGITPRCPCVNTFPGEADAFDLPWRRVALMTQPVRFAARCGPASSADAIPSNDALRVHWRVQVVLLAVVARGVRRVDRRPRARRAHAVRNLFLHFQYSSTHLPGQWARCG